MQENHEPIEIAYEMSMRHLWAFHKRIYAKFWPVWVLVLLSLPGILLAFDVAGDVDMSTALPTNAVILPIWASALLFLAWFRVWVHIRERYSCKPTLRLRLEPGGLHASEPGAEGKIEWSKIRKVEVTPRYFFLYVTYRQAFIVPRAAFADQAEADAFLKRAKEYWEAAKDRVQA